MGLAEFKAALQEMGANSLPHFSRLETEVIETLGDSFGFDRIAKALTNPTDDSRKFVGLDLDYAAKIAQQRIFPYLIEGRGKIEQILEPDWDVLNAGLIEIQTRGGMEIDGPYSNLAPFLKSWGSASGEALRQLNEFQQQSMIPYQVSVVRSYAGKR